MITTLKALNVTAISPHHDDIALSLTNTFVQLLSLNIEINIKLICCFTKTEYAPYCNSNGCLTPSEIRANEDRKYLELIGFSKFSQVNLGFTDAPLRDEWSDLDENESENYEYLSQCEKEKYSSLVGESFSQLFERSRLYFVPIGIGHKDHVIVREAFVRSYRNSPVIFYSDLPYTFLDNKDKASTIITNIEDRIGSELIKIRIHNNFYYDKWVSSIKCYKSQFGEKEMSEISELCNLQGGDILYSNAIALEILNKLNIDFLVV